MRRLIASFLPGIALLLASCAPQHGTTRIDTIDKPVVRYADIPTRYTDQLMAPALPDHQLTWQDLDDELAQFEAIFARANDDRGKVKSLSGTICNASPATECNK